MLDKKTEKRKDRRAVELFLLFLTIFVLTNVHMAIGVILIVLGILFFIVFWGSILMIPITALGAYVLHKEHKEEEQLKKGVYIGERNGRN